MPVRPASEADLEAVAPLMAAYCEFYEVESPNTAALEEMCRALIAAPDSEGLLLVAENEGGEVEGFAAVGWKWSSLRGARVAILEDLFVDPSARRQGHGRALIDACADRVRTADAPCLIWLTATDNKAAQSVYDATGATSEEFLEYELGL